MNRVRTVFAAALMLAALTPIASAQGLTGTLRSTTGGSVSAAQLQGRVVVLLFGGIVDPQSPEELPVLQQLSDRYAGKGVDVFWVSLDPAATTDAELTAFAGRNGYRGPIMRDSGEVLRSISTGRKPQLPTIVVLDKTGAVSGRPMGGFDRDMDMVTRLGAIVDPLLK